MRVDGKQFLRALEYVAKTTTGESVPTLASLFMDARPGRVRVAATDLEVLVETEVAAEGDDTWQVLVNRQALRPLKAIADRTLELSARPSEAEGNKRTLDLVVTTGPDEETVLVGRDPCDWPDWGDDLPHLYGMAEIGLWEWHLLRHLLDHAADSDQRPVLSGIYLDGAGWTATDTTRLLHVPHRLGSAEFDGIPGAIFPARALELLLASPYPTQTVTIRITGAPPHDGKGEPMVASLEAGPIRIWTRLVPGNFPPYRNVLPPQGHHHQFMVEPDQFPKLRQVLRAVDSLARRKPSVVTVRFSEHQLTIESSEADVGTMRSRIPVNRWDGTLAAEAAYQAQFLRDMLGVFEKLGEPVYATLDPSSPACFASPSGVICVIAPVRS